MLKLIFSIHIIVILTLAACDNKQNRLDSSTVTKTDSQITASDLPTDQNGLSHASALIKTVHGNIIFKFYPKKAPNTVTRMIELIQQGFYDGHIFQCMEAGGEKILDQEELQANSDRVFEADRWAYPCIRHGHDQVL